MRKVSEGGLGVINLQQGVNQERWVMCWEESGGAKPRELLRVRQALGRELVAGSYRPWWRQFLNTLLLETET